MKTLINSCAKSSCSPTGLAMLVLLMISFGGVEGLGQTVLELRPETQIQANIQRSGDLETSFRAFEVFSVDMDALQKTPVEREEQEGIQLQITGHGTLEFTPLAQQPISRDRVKYFSEGKAKPYTGPMPVVLQGGSGGDDMLIISPGYLSGNFDKGGERYLVEPLYKWVKEAPHNQFILVKETDAITPSEEFCGTEIGENDIRDSHGARDAAATLPCLSMDFLIVADHAFYTQHGNNTVAEMLAIYGVAQGLYTSNNIGIFFQPIIGIFSDGDPFEVTPDTQDLLWKFRNWALNNAGLLPDYDLAHLFTEVEFPFESGAIGRAYISGVCSLFSKFGVNITSIYNNTLNGVLVAHEVGHNLGAEHDEQTAGCPAGDDFIMMPSLNYRNTFSACSKNFFLSDFNGGGMSCATLDWGFPQAPQISGCPSNIVISSPCDNTASWVAPTATDNCAVTSFSQTAGPASGSGFPVGTTTVTYQASDYAGHTSTCSFQVTFNPPQPVIAGYTVSDVSCNGAADGSIALLTLIEGCGPITYLWSDGQVTQTASGLSAGTYGVTITDPFGQTAATSIIVNQPPPETLSLTETASISCYGGSDGAATVDASDLIYSWSNKQTAQTATGLSAGTYYVTATDAYGCISEGAITLNEPTPVTGTAGPDLVAYFGYPNSVQLSVSASGGTPGYTYSWSPSDDLVDANTATPTFTPSAAGTFDITATITDANGCTGTAIQTVQVEDVNCENNDNQDKVVMCHNGKTICVGITAVQVHLDHGDQLGPCQTDNNALSGGGTNGAVEAAKQHASPNLQAYPNPFAGELNIRYELPQAEQELIIRIHDLSGAVVDQLWAGPADAGANTLHWHGEALPAGVYVLSLQTEKERLTRQLVLVR